MRSEFLVGFIIVLFLVIAPVSGTGINRIVEPGSDNSTEVRLIIVGGPVLGITETLPAGANVTACSLPAAQYRLSPGSLHLAAIGDTEVSYTLQGGESNLISGTWTDFSDGSKGTIPNEGQSSSPPPQSATPTAPATTQAAGAGFIPSLSGLCLLVVVVLFRRHGQ